MKIVVIVLSVLVVFTHQQFYQPSTTAERLFWLSRYYSPRPAFDYYNRQPVNYADDNQGDDDDSFHPFMPPSPSAFPQARPYLNAVENPNDEEGEDQFPVQVQGRRKTMNSFPTRFRPSFLQPKPQKDDPRFLINLASPNLITRKVKTITFTLTSSLTFTSVQSCIPSAQFYTGAADIACRRKRRGGIVAPLDALDISKPEDTEFAITPTDVQPVEPTELTSLDLSNEHHQWAKNQTLNHGLVSSMNEDLNADATAESLVSTPAVRSRGQRFFVHLVTTTTVTSYSFLSTTVTKTVSLLNTLLNPGGGLICLPYGYSVCPYTSLFPG
ncbi:uncharacterized protein LOC124205689 isoform X2 [Daphnia pulex]|uniref:uncharacterized protein LOC124205689 isoform X2 n=1 Tax=Daphnia pulex TaxID=6669 RepID=UPI001EE060C4|nr:uncharacterized protein LOC124205689 isoform X2 [Daphnia pulex]